jgi:rhodanese-related sulfurtransferase
VKAEKIGFSKNIRIMKDGVFEWGKAYPGKSIFFNEKMNLKKMAELVEPEKKIKPKMLDLEEFIRRGNSPGAFFIDIRDINDRLNFPVLLPNLKAYPIDRMVELIRIKSRILRRKTMYIFDNSGSQVLWLQFVLEKAGMDNYFFLEGGVAEWEKGDFVGANKGAGNKPL